MATPPSPESLTPIQFLENTGLNGSLIPTVCYAHNMISQGGTWLGENIMDYTMPLFIIQLLLIIVLTRTIAFLLKPLRQPRYISEIMGGFILGPAVMGRVPGFSNTFFPFRSLVVLEAIAHIGLIYFIFAVGVEVESRTIQRAGLARSLAFAAVATAAAVTVGGILGPSIQRRTNDGLNEGAYRIFLGVSLSVTSLSGLARILAERKMIGSDIGRLALSSAILVNGYSWVLLSVCIGMAFGKGSSLTSAWSGLSAMGFSMFCMATVRLAVNWVVRRTPDGEEVDELHASTILVGVMVAAFCADAIGTHAIFGAFLYGVSVPSDPVGQALVEKIEDLVEGILLPLFYVFSGMRANPYSMKSAGAAGLMTVAVLVGVALKMAQTVVAAVLFKMPIRDGLALGILMNTKGAMELVVLNIGKDKHLIGDESYTVLMILSVIVTAIVGPLQTLVMKPVRRQPSYKRRTIRWHNPDSELRLLVCVHNPRNVPAFITLVDASNPTKRSPIFVIALHLVELTGRSSAVLVASNAHPKSQRHRSNSSGRVHAKSDHIMQAFESYEQHAGGVSIQTLSVFSPYSTMHEDIADIAENRHTALILLPFHKHKTVDGGMEVTHPAIRALNRSVSDASPCSVAVLVDRGLGSLPRGLHAVYRIAMLFIGGIDDREALAYASRMAGNPGATLTIVHFIHSDRRPMQEAARVVAAEERERRVDDEFIKQMVGRGREGVAYLEQVVDNAEETVATMRAMASGYDLYIVGKGEEESPLTAGMTEFSECPELGPIGDFLASSDFLSTVSILVVKYGGGVGPAAAEAQAASPESPRKQVRLYVYDDQTTKA